MSQVASEIKGIFQKRSSTVWLDIILLFLFGVVMRIPFQSQILHEYDSANFALALENFDLRLHQPHPPGMFVFFILLGRFFNSFLHDANASFVWLNTIVSGLATATIYWLGRVLFDRKTGWIIALVMLTSPLVWFQGEVALSYMLEFWWVLLIIIGCYYLRQGNQFAFFATATLMGMAGGIRPNTLFFLLPIWLYTVGLSVRSKKFSLRHVAIAFGLIGVGTLCWLTPMVMLSGGPDEFKQAMQLWFNRHSQDGAGRGFYGLYLNFKQLVEAILYGMGLSFLVALWVSVTDWKMLKSTLKQDWRAAFLVVWIVPALLYLSIIHIQRLGHAFTIMPALMILGGLAIVHAGKRLQAVHRHAASCLVAIVLLGNSLFFLLGPGKLDNIPTYTTIRDYDAYNLERIAAIRNQFPPAETVVLARGRNSGVREIYLRDYVGSVRLSPMNRFPFVLSEPIKYLVLFDSRGLPKVTDQTAVQTIELPTQNSIQYITWNSAQKVNVNESSISIE